MAEGRNQSAFMFFTPTGDLKGESRESHSELVGKFPMEITKVDLKADNPTNIGSAGKDKQGKVKFDPFEFTKPTDRSTVGFFKSLSSGKEYETAEIHVHRNKDIFMKIVFSACVISEVHLTQEGDEESMDNIKMDYGAVKFTYFEQDRHGNMKPKIETSWNRVKNAPD